MNKYTKITKTEFDALKKIYESVFESSDLINEQIMFKGIGSIESPRREVAPSRPIKIMDEQDAALDIDAIEADIDNQLSAEEPALDNNKQKPAGDNEQRPEGDDSSNKFSIAGEEQNTAESVIKLTVQMAIFKGVRDVADEFSKSFDIDKFAVLARFQKYLLNPENLENASASVVQLIKTKKKQQQEKERQQLIQQSKKSKE